MVQGSSFQLVGVSREFVTPIHHELQPNTQESLRGYFRPDGVHQIEDSGVGHFVSMLVFGLH